VGLGVVVGYVNTGFSILENTAAAAAAAAADTSSSTNTSSSTIFTVYSKLEYPVYYKMENTRNIVVSVPLGITLGVLCSVIYYFSTSEALVRIVLTLIASIYT
jgi:hypothetical protein